MNRNGTVSHMTTGYSGDLRITGRARRRRRARSFQLHKLILFLVFTLVLAFLCGISFGSILSKAETTEAKASETFKYYKSITVQPGDSLWSIAADHMSEEYPSIQSYIEEVQFINSLNNTSIHAGKHLTIPYYSAEFKYK